jgi:hypothetical protein
LKTSKKEQSASKQGSKYPEDVSLSQDLGVKKRDIAEFLNNKEFRYSVESLKKKIIETWIYTKPGFEGVDVREDLFRQYHALLSIPQLLEAEIRSSDFELRRQDFEAELTKLEND